VTDTAQSTTGLVRRLVNDPNSTIGAMIKRGSLGVSSGSLINGISQPLVMVNSSSDQSTDLTKKKSTRELDFLEQAINEAKTAMSSIQSTQPINSDFQSTPQPTQAQNSDDFSSNPQPARAQSLTDQTQNSRNSWASKTQPSNTVAEGVMSQAMPQAINQAIDDAGQQQTSVTGKKEAIENVGLDQVAIDAARGAQLVETEPQPEIPPEVESYLEKVEERKETAPQEIVIADGTQASPNNRSYPAQPVVVLPITAAEEKEGIKKSPKFSIRWLVEWSKKLMKIFMGKVIYRPVEEKIDQ